MAISKSFKDSVAEAEKRLEELKRTEEMIRKFDFITADTTLNDVWQNLPSLVEFTLMGDGSYVVRRSAGGANLNNGNITTRPVRLFNEMDRVYMAVDEGGNALTPLLTLRSINEWARASELEDYYLVKVELVDLQVGSLEYDLVSWPIKAKE